MKFKKISTATLLFALILLLQLALLFVASLCKDGFNIDDILSYQLANSLYLPYLELSPDFINYWHDSSYFMDAITTTSESTSFVYSSVLYNQMQDVHPPLYYFALHTVCSIFRGAFSKWLGLAVNFVFFAGTSVQLYKTAQLFFLKNTFVLLPVLLWGFSIGAFSTFLLIRMYMMLSFATMLHLYLHLRFVSGKKLTLWRVCIIFASLLFGFMTHYYFLIFAFFLTLAECLAYLSQKEIVPMLLYGFSNCGAVLLGFAIYPAAYRHIFENYRGQESFDSFFQFSQYLTRLGTLVQTVSVSVTLGAAVATLAMGVLLLSLWHKKTHATLLRITQSLAPTPEIPFMRYFFVAGFSAIASFFLVAMIIGYNAERYLYYTFPTIALALAIAIALLCAALPMRSGKAQLCAVLAALCALGAGWAGQVPAYLEPESAAAIADAQTHQDASCIYVINKTWHFVAYYIELANYRQVMFVNQEDFETLESTMASLEEDGFAHEIGTEELLVYLPIGTAPDAYFDYLAETFGYADATLLRSHAYSDVYLLTAQN